MTWRLASTLITLTQLVAAAPDAQVTPRAELYVRQASADPSLLGWVSTSGASQFSDLRSCDFPATLSRSGSYAQCCATSGPCDFFTSCADGNLIAASTSIFCDQGFCNTGVIVPTTGASSGESFLGCWATSLGSAAFTMAQDIGSAATAAPSTASTEDSSASDNSASPTSGSESETRTSTGRQTVEVGSSSTGASSTGAAALPGRQPLTGAVAFLAGLLALL